MGLETKAQFFMTNLPKESSVLTIVILHKSF